MPDHNETSLSLGPCCICGATGPQVKVIVLLNARSPLAGKGWNCVQCGLSANGAVAVICESCERRHGTQQQVEDALRWFCRGAPGRDGRLPIEALRGEHGHNRRRHPECPQIPPLQVVASDTRWPTHVEEGHGCTCSRCGQTIWQGVGAIRVWPEQGDWAYRFHPTCLGACRIEEDPYSDEEDW